MSLGLSFNLTPAQTKALMIVASYRYRGKGWGTSDSDVLLPAFESSHFVTVMQTLGRKGLVTHDSRREPTYLPTPEGEAIASIIARTAQELLDIHSDIPSRKRKMLAQVTARV